MSPLRRWIASKKLLLRLVSVERSCPMMLLNKCFFRGFPPLPRKEKPHRGGGEFHSCPSWQENSPIWNCWHSTLVLKWRYNTCPPLQVKLLGSTASDLANVLRQTRLWVLKWEAGEGSRSGPAHMFPPREGSRRVCHDALYWEFGTAKFKWKENTVAYISLCYYSEKKCVFSLTLILWELK